MSDLVAGVDGEVRLDGVEVLGGGPPVPGNALLECLERHALDPGQHPHQVLAVGGVVGQGGDGESAVPPDHRGHAVEGRRAEGAVPEGLGIEVGVDVDEPRGHDASVSIDRVGGLVVDVAERHDSTVDDAEVGAPAIVARAIDDPATADHSVEH